MFGERRRRRWSAFDSDYRVSNSKGVNESRARFHIRVLYQAAYEVGRYITLEQLIKESKESYFEERVGAITTARGAKREMARKAIERLPDQFTVKELRRACPGASPDMVRVVTRELRKEYLLTCTGHGPGALSKKKGNMKKIGQKNVLDCEQHKIVIYLDSVRSKAEESKRQQQTTRAELDKVIPSVLSRDFQGEL